MFEKVNPAHPDKIADRIAGAIVLNENPKIEQYSIENDEGLYNYYKAFFDAFE